jgi:hypothetical protein
MSLTNAHPADLGRVGARANAKGAANGAYAARDLGSVNSYRSAIAIVGEREGLSNPFKAKDALDRTIKAGVEKLLQGSDGQHKVEPAIASQVCVTTLRNRFASKSTESRVQSNESRPESRNPWSSEALYDLREESENGQHDAEQSEFRWMQGFFVRGYTLTEALIEIKQRPAVQAQFRKMTPGESAVKEKTLMRKLIRARDSAAHFNEMIDEAKKVPLEALPLPEYDADTRRAAALFEFAAKRSRAKSFPVPMSAVAHLLECLKEEARRTIRDLINIPFIEQARKGKGSQAACYKLASALPAQPESDDDDVF